MKNFRLCMNQVDNNGSVIVYCGNDTFQLEILNHQINAFCTKCGYAIVITRKKEAVQ